MLATPRPPSSSPHAFLPAIPSPLSPRSANIYGRNQRHFMSDPPKSHNDNDATPFSKRAVRKAPTPIPDALREKRRGMFLRKVEESRQDRRFESRGEDILRLDYLREHRQWLADRKRDAPDLSSSDVVEEEEEWGLPISSTDAMQFSAPPSQQLPFLMKDDEAVDEVLQQEDMELEALLEYMPTNDRVEQHPENASLSESQQLWSDGEDYDALFSDLVESNTWIAESAAPTQQPISNSTMGEAGEDTAMDLS